ncbi:hypothetical protein BB558_000994 [Smittium angustum]|uniref:G-protein coupled receptors family 1 profile domain-containing protein n=1 Tax=Smittium angustum TaxID=133377 RepID=A0A2U1JCM0_SMIAN|nr:hypothetical protein BB558_000994 [Smittium angustum]
MSIEKRQIFGKSKSFMNDFFVGVSVMHGISIVCCTIVILSVLYTKRVKKEKLVLSFRISFWIAFFDMVYSLASIILYKKNDVMVMKPTVSKVVAWVMQGSMLSTIMLSCAIAFSLQLNLVVRDPFKKRANWCYEYIAIIIAFVASSMVLYLFKMVVWDGNLHQFFLFSGSTKNSRIRVFSSNYLFTIIGVLYCYIVFLHVGVSLSIFQRFTKLRFFHVNSQIATNVFVTPEKKRKTLNAIKWLLCYPLVPILTQTFVIVFGLFDPNLGTFCIGAFMPATQGTLNLFVFLLSPKFRELYSNHWSKKL